MSPIRHQQIPEGDAFVEPRNVDTVKGLLAAAADLGLDPSVVRTQQGGYLAPKDVVEKAQLDESAEVTDGEEPEETEDEEPEETEDDGVPAASASKADWEAYAVSQGYDAEEGLTKAQLIERYGASE